MVVSSFSFRWSFEKSSDDVDREVIILDNRSLHTTTTTRSSRRHSGSRIVSHRSSTSGSRSICMSHMSRGVR